MVDTIPAPFRTQFDEARDPLTARNRLGAVSASDVAAQITAAGSSYATAANFPAGAWTAWSPTLTADAGTITSYTINTARYTKAGKAVTAYFDITINNQGTAAGHLRMTLPVTCSASGGGFGVCREVAVSGHAGGGAVSASAAALKLVRYDGSSIMITTYQIVGTMVYEAA